MLDFIVFMVQSRWFTVFASFMLMAGSGGTYVFGTYSQELKTAFGYDQTTLNVLGTSKDIGASMGIISGLIAEVTPTWFVLLVGAVANFFGYFMIWLGVAGKIPKPTVWQMCTYIAIGTNSQNFINTGAVVTCVKNFPESRGIMVGLLKGYVGLSGAIMTQLYLGFYGDDRKDLILFVGWFPALMGVFFLYAIRPMKVDTKLNDGELKVFFHFLLVSIALALFLMALTLTQQSTTFSNRAQAATSTAVFFMLVFPLFICIREELDNFKLKQQPPSQITIVSPQNPLSHTSKSEISHPKCTSFFSDIFNKPPRGDDHTILQALLSIDMLIIIIVTTLGLGSSMTACANIGQIGGALGYKPSTMNTFVSLMSVCNFFGRVVSGYASEIFLMRDQVPRTLMLTMSLALASIGYLLIAFPAPGFLYIASVINGFTLGAQYTLVLSIISELFGLKYYSTLYNCGAMASPIGSYLLNVKLTGMLYDRQAEKNLAKLGETRAQGEALSCYGKKCFQMAFIILAAVTLFSALVSYILVRRTREFYEGDIYRKFRENAENVKGDEAEMISTASVRRDKTTLHI